MNASAFWCLLAVMVFVSIALNYIAGMHGAAIYSPQVLELHFAFYWYSLVYHSLSNTVFDIGKRTTDFESAIKPVYGYLFLVYITVSLGLRFGLNLDIIWSYLVCVLVVVYLPLFAFQLYLPRWKKSRSTAKLPQSTIKTLAFQTHSAQEFMDVFDPVKVYITHNTRESHCAKCILHHRRARSESPTMMEDICLEILIDLEHQLAIEEKSYLSHYVFETDDEASVVMQLDTPATVHELQQPHPLSDEKLMKFDQMFARHPSLLETPLQIAELKGAFVAVDV